MLKVLRTFYVVDKNKKGDKYCGITLDWDYVKRKVHLSTGKVQDQPHQHSIPMYGATIQYAKKLDDSPKLDKEDKLFIQQVTGTFLYYARAVDSTMLVTLSAIAAQQSDPTVETMKKTLKLLDYVVTHPDAVLTFNASSMVLNVHSDASYLTEPKARSRAGDHFFMSENNQDPKNNDAVLNIAKIIKSVMSSAAEAEI